MSVYTYVMQVNAKMTPVETVPGIGVGDEREQQREWM
jgi:hypothetical protein